jgi:CRISPR-associated exonuclease Cas4
MLVLILVLLLCAIVFLARSKKLSKESDTLKKTHKIPDGRITYTDLHIPAKPLFSKRYRLTGKPDYIVQDTRGFIPVEFKLGDCSKPKKHHLLQLAAYCQLVEDTSGGFVPYGILIYNNTHQYRIPYDPMLRFELESVLHEMRTTLRKGMIQEKMGNSEKCVYCSMRNPCTHMFR